MKWMFNLLSVLALVCAGLGADAWFSTAQANRSAAGSAADFDRIMRANRIQQTQVQGMQNWGQQGDVKLGLEAYQQLREQLLALDNNRQPDPGPLVSIGSADYRGTAQNGVLTLNCRLQVSLAAAGAWKTIPLVGDQVVLAAARLDGEELPLATQNGYHVWVSDRAGDFELQLDLLVDSKGPRGSLEYDFSVVKSTATQVSLTFPEADLEPRLQGAIRSETRSENGQTLFQADLPPTHRIQLLGLRDLGEQQSQGAKLYAESMNLVSVDEGQLEQFVVIRYNILYAGNKQFDVLLPPGMELVSADGPGAFRYELEETEKGQLLKGETSFPIRNSYEISLRLKRDLSRATQANKAEAFKLQPPALPGTERAYGWLAVEVIGNLKLEEQQRQRVLAVDVRQLPFEMVQSAVAPILKAYRYHEAQSEVLLSALRLPEKEPATASIDQLFATTVVSTEGTQLTDLQIKLRNRLRHALSLRLPEGVKVRSSQLDGQPIKPSLTSDGVLKFPLKRSSGSERLKPITLQIVLEQQADALGLLAHTDLGLPPLELPISKLRWDVWLPARNHYRRLGDDQRAPKHVGSGRWYRPRLVEFSSRNGFADIQQDFGARGGLQLGQNMHQSQLRLAEPEAEADSGALPVKIELPRTGKRLQYKRYWIAADQTIETQVLGLRSWLVYPLLVLATLLAVWLSTKAWRRWRWWLLAAPLLAVLAVSEWAWLISFILLTSLAIACWQGRWLQRGWQWWRSHGQQADKTELAPVSAAGWLNRLILLGASSLLLLALMLTLVRAIGVLT